MTDYTRLRIPKWVIDGVGSEPDYYLLYIEPNGNCEVDGAFASPEGVAESKVLYESINALRIQPGTRYLMLTLQAVPEIPVRVNQDAIDTLNKHFSD